MGEPLQRRRQEDVLAPRPQAAASVLPYCTPPRASESQDVVEIQQAADGRVSVCPTGRGVSRGADRRTGGEPGHRRHHRRDARSATRIRFGFASAHFPGTLGDSRSGRVRQRPWSTRSGGPSLARHGPRSCGATRRESGGAGPCWPRWAQFGPDRYGLTIVVVAEASYALGAALVDIEVGDPCHLRTMVNGHAAVPVLDMLKRTRAARAGNGRCSHGVLLAGAFTIDSAAPRSDGEPSGSGSRALFAHAEHRAPRGLRSPELQRRT